MQIPRRARGARYPIISTEFGRYDCGTRYTAQAIASHRTPHFLAGLVVEPGRSRGQPTLISDWCRPARPAPYGACLMDADAARAHG